MVEQGLVDLTAYAHQSNMYYNMCVGLVEEGSWPTALVQWPSSFETWRLQVWKVMEQGLHRSNLYQNAVSYFLLKGRKLKFKKRNLYTTANTKKWKIKNILKLSQK